MLQMNLIHEDVYSALRSTVECLGGAKKVAALLWPTMDFFDAERRLLDCLNPKRKQKLDLPEFMTLWRMSRELDINILAGFIAQEFGYRMEPITVEERQASILERWNAAKAEVFKLAELMGRT